MTTPEKKQAVRLFLFDDDPFEHLIFQRLIKKIPTEVRLTSAHSEEELRMLLPGSRPHLIICDSHIPPFYDFGESVAIIREMGYDGEIIVASSVVDTSREHPDVAMICGKSEFTPSMFDGLVSRFALMPNE